MRNPCIVFAGNFVHNTDYGIVKVGTGTWTLTGSIDAHRPFVVQEGTVSTSSAIRTARSRSVM